MPRPPTRKPVVTSPDRRPARQAMEEAEELTDAEEQELVAALRVLASTLPTLIAEGEQSETVSLDESIGRLARMDAMQHQKMAKTGTDQHRRRLGLVQQALRAAEDGAYGFCRRCEEPVGFRRLQARPEAPFCLGCQNLAETR